MLSWRRMMAPNLAPGVDALRCHASPAAGAGLGECVIWDRQRRPGTAPLPGSRWPLSARTFSQPTATTQRHESIASGYAGDIHG